MLAKSYAKNRRTCRVTFVLSREAAEGASRVEVLGDFNAWQEGSTPMKLGSDGSWQARLSLEAGHEYRFRYLVDGRTWLNDWNADKYLPSDFSDADNSVVIV
jgi:1,4-alpha-glucan branching enzyme